MINYIKGDLFTTPDRIIVHGCNAAGVMGSGVAKIVKDKYPKAFEEYRRHYETSGNQLSLGLAIASHQPDGKTIVNAITQGAYGYGGEKYVSYDAVDMVMSKLASGVAQDEPISMPMIGAGLGGGNWQVIEAIINARLKDHTVNIYVL